MTPALPQAFLGAPIAHRALHDRAAGRSENSAAAIRAAVAEGYGIEIDVQLSADGEAMVFHDEALKRLTGRDGLVRDHVSSDLAGIELLAGGGTIPTLADCLRMVAGRVALLIEVKDQDGAMGPQVGPLEDAVARNLSGYGGPVAVMSFNPHSVRAMARLAPDVPRGLTTCAWTDEDAEGLDEAALARLRAIADFGDVGASFISHDAADLGSPAVAALKARGVPILCWTIRSAEAEAQARKVADNITFEGYPARNPPAP